MRVWENKTDCSGCRACEMKCPKDAITMQEDEEGFIYPDIDADKCIKCHLCEKICPQVHHERFMNDGPIAFYGGAIKDEKLLLKSSSGGAFSAICQALGEDTVVCGAVYGQNLQVRHEMRTGIDNLSAFRKSKYVQSDVQHVYVEVKEKLDVGKTVLFTGTACQVAGLYAYLGNKPTNLYTLDLICHGVPSQKVFDAYIQDLSRQIKMRITRYSFREKSYFWGDWEIGVKFGNEQKETYRAWGQDEYMFGFLRAMYYRPVCYQCAYANAQIARPADFTIGDFWGSARIDPKYHEKRGSSLIIVHSEKAQKLMARIANVMDFVQIQKEDAVRENHNLVEPTKMNPHREAFYQSLNSGKPFLTIVKQYISRKSFPQKVRVIGKRLLRIKK